MVIINTVGCVAVEVDMGSATSWGRHPGRAWLVRLRRGDRSVIVAWGLSDVAAEHVAERITDLLGGAGLGCSQQRRAGGGGWG